MGVQRAISCLLDNARKFDETGGPIEVTVGGGAVAVSDRGTGIPEADLDSIFDRFYRADEVRAPMSGFRASVWRSSARSPGVTVAKSGPRTTMVAGPRWGFGSLLSTTDPRRRSYLALNSLRFASQRGRSH